MRRAILALIATCAFTLFASMASAQIQQPGFGGPTRVRHLPTPTPVAPNVGVDRSGSLARIVEAKLRALAVRTTLAIRPTAPYRTEQN